MQEETVEERISSKQPAFLMAWRKDTMSVQDQSPGHSGHLEMAPGGKPALANLNLALGQGPI